MKKPALLFFILFSYVLNAQPPVVHFNFVSHNEPADNLQNLINFNNMNSRVMQLAGIIDTYNASWNLETCDGYAKGALDYQGVSSNIFKTLAQSPYNDNIEIDPRSKQTIYGTIADLYHVLDSLGGNPTHTLGGFICNTSDNINHPVDWFQYQDTTQGSTFPTVKWKCNLMWGAGSYMPHSNDYNDYGIWKPDSVNTFGTHNPNRNVWFIGNGCQPINALDSTEDPLDILVPLKNFIDSIQSGYLPQDKFYAYSVTINQSHFGPTLFQKIAQICDSITAWGNAKIKWARLTEKYAAFQLWQTTTGLDSSIWKCGTTVDINENMRSEKTGFIYPNPTSGKLTVTFSDTEEHYLEIYSTTGNLILEKNIYPGENVILNGSPGIYLFRIDRKTAHKIIRQ